MAFVTICDSRRGERDGKRSESEATGEIGEAGGRAAQRFCGEEREGKRAYAEAAKLIEGCSRVAKIQGKQDKEQQD